MRYNTDYYRDPMQRDAYARGYDDGCNEYANDVNRYDKFWMVKDLPMVADKIADAYATGYAHGHAARPLPTYLYSQTHRGVVARRLNLDQATYFMADYNGLTTTTRDTKTTTQTSTWKGK
jgi:hypothetical protein